MRPEERENSRQERAGVRLGVAGAGIMGAKVARAAAQVADMTVAAVADGDLGRAKGVAGDLGAVAFGSVEEMCSSGLIDAVYVGLPNAVRASAAWCAADNGLHALIDKPLAVTHAEALEVQQAHVASGRIWMTGFSSRFRHEVIAARELIRSGRLGEVYFVSGEVIEAYEQTPAWYWDEAAGGGVLNLQAHHSFDRWEWLLGKSVEEVFACLTSTPSTHGSREMGATVAVRFAGGATASASLAFGEGYAAVPRGTFCAVGTRGMLRLDETRTLMYQGADESWSRTYSNDWLGLELSTFVGAIRGEVTEYPTILDGVRAALLADAARACSEGGGVSVADRDGTDPL